MLPPFVKLDDEGLDVQVCSKYITLLVYILSRLTNRDLQAC